MQRSVTGSIIEIQCKSAEKLHFHIIRRLLSIIFHFYNPKALKHHIFRSSRTSHCNFLSFFPPNYYNVFFCIKKKFLQEYPTSLLKPYVFLLQSFFSFLFVYQMFMTIVFIFSFSILLLLLQLDIFLLNRIAS